MLGTSCKVHKILTISKLKLLNISNPDESPLKMKVNKLILSDIGYSCMLKIDSIIFKITKYKLA